MSKSKLIKEQAGEYPFTSGIHPRMYQERLWTMRQYAGFGSADETNKRYRYLLSQGTTGLSVAFDLPTQMGRDPDHQRSKGEVGRVGVSIACVDDMERLFQGVPLSQVSVSMTINSTASILLAMLLIVAERQGVKWSELRGTVQNDILKEYISRGTYIYPPDKGLRLATDLFKFCGEQVPQWNTISISGYHIREAGSTAVDELSFTFANAITYIESALKKGLKLEQFAPRLAFFFNCQMDLIEEVAKFRAARRIWARIIKERFKSNESRSQMLRFHTQTAGSSLTAKQPLNNVVRTSIEAMAAVFGGTQSLHTNSFDEALGLPTEDSATLALRTQQIIAYESGIPKHIDPFAGSYVVEELTDKIEKQVFNRIEQIDEMGGMLLAIEAGFPQREIERTAYETQRAFENGEQIVVGVNRFTSDNQSDIELQKIDPQIEQDQVKRINALRAKRDSNKVLVALTALSDVAKAEGDIFPSILAALRADATLGEVAESLRTVFGEHKAFS
jgi:methylmalonyl-CoA mutase, N-terminal domain